MKTFLRALVVLASLSPLACSAATTDEYKLGQHYFKANEPQTPANPAKIEVMEVFAYSCPHCYALEPLLQKWRATLPGDVEFVRMPNTLGAKDNEARNRGYYAARMLGVADKFHPALFEALHRDRQPTNTPAAVRELFLKSTGVAAADYDAAIGSFAVDAGFRRGENAARAIGVTAVPTLVIDGKLFVQPRGMGLDGLLKVADHLVKEARKERAKR